LPKALKPRGSAISCTVTVATLTKAIFSAGQFQLKIFECAAAQADGLFAPLYGEILLVFVLDLT